MKLRGKVAIITGADSGIGQATAELARKRAPNCHNQAARGGDWGGA